MDFALRPGRGLMNAFVSGSFNPCFSGFRIATRSISYYVTDSERVSILVLVDFALRHDLAGIYHSGYGVSILVLVDFALRLSDGANVTLWAWSFNPCFSGFRIATNYF